MRLTGTFEMERRPSGEVACGCIRAKERER